MNQEEQNKISEEYEKTLVVPKVVPERKFLLCPVGLVGSGKTTVVKPLAERLSLVRISGDDIRKLLKEHGYGYEKAFAIAADLGKKYIEKGYSVAIDSDCASEHTRKLIAEAKEKYGAIPVWIHINPPEAFILEKLRNFEHTWLFRDAEHAIWNYLQRKPLHENLDMPFVYTFDPSRADVEEQLDSSIAAIKRYLQNYN